MGPSRIHRHELEYDGLDVNFGYTTEHPNQAPGSVGENQCPASTCSCSRSFCLRHRSPTMGAPGSLGLERIPSGWLKHCARPFTGTYRNDIVDAWLKDT